MLRQALFLLHGASRSRAPTRLLRGTCAGKPGATLVTLASPLLAPLLAGRCAGVAAASAIPVTCSAAPSCGVSAPTPTFSGPSRGLSSKLERRRPRRAEKRLVTAAQLMNTGREQLEGNDEDEQLLNLGISPAGFEPDIWAEPKYAKYSRRKMLVREMTDKMIRNREVTLQEMDEGLARTPREREEMRHALLAHVGVRKEIYDEMEESERLRVMRKGLSFYEAQDEQEAFREQIAEWDEEFPEDEEDDEIDTLMAQKEREKDLKAQEVELVVLNKVDFNIKEAALAEERRLLREKEDSMLTASVFGRGIRKSSKAFVTLREGEGRCFVNGVPNVEYFKDYHHRMQYLVPMRAAGLEMVFDTHAIVHGGGNTGQAEAIRMGVVRALLKFDPALRRPLKAAGLLTVDARKVERKKPGLKKARKARQWVKR